VTEIITIAHKTHKVRHAGLFTSSSHNSLRSGSLAWLTWEWYKSLVVVWRTCSKTCLERSIR